MVKVQEDFFRDFKEEMLRLLKRAGFKDKTVETATAQSICRKFFNLKLRAIRPLMPRDVLWSSELRNKQLSTEVADALSRIESDIVQGRPLDKYLSNTVLKPPRSKRGRVQRQIEKANDMLFNDWGVHHFHLGLPGGERDPVQRTGDLLFLFVKEARAHFIDIYTHGHFSAQAVVDTMESNWPEIKARGQLLGLASGTADESSKITDEALGEARENGITVIRAGQDGSLFVGPGAGYATDGSNLKSVNQAEAAIKKVWEIKDAVHRCSRQIAEEIGTKSNTPVTSALTLRLALEDTGQSLKFHVVDSRTGVRLYPYSSHESAKQNEG